MGCQAQSKEWETIREYLVVFGKDQMVAGDFAKYDKTMPPQLIIKVFDILKALGKMCGYSEEDLLVLDCIAIDVAFPLIDFNGDLVMFHGSNPSGHPLTVIVNSLAGSILMRMAYCICVKTAPLSSFKNNVSLMTYGDDNVMGICPSISDEYNHTTIQQALDKFGIVYTMAEKERASVPLINIDDVSFLKRKWVWSDELGHYVCPLENDSIDKMLLIGVKSKSISPEAQSVEAMKSALGEYFWYGREIYENKLELLKKISKKAGLQHYIDEDVFQAWEALADQYHKRNESL